MSITIPLTLTKAPWSLTSGARKTAETLEAPTGHRRALRPALKGEFTRTLNLTCVPTGWVFTRTMHNNSLVHALTALQPSVEEIPFTIRGLDFDNGTEFLNKAVTACR